jgi:tRNA U55 pseudouridine synthase TruB
LLPVDSLVADLPRIELSENDARDIRNGKLVSNVVATVQSGSYRLYAPGNVFLGLGEFDSHAMGALRSQRLMSTAAD